jgi:hypothetical protein
VLASANAINYGGTKEISDWELHEQMEDGEGELDATTIAHIAIGWATNILSPQTGAIDTWSDEAARDEAART